MKMDLEFQGGLQGYFLSSNFLRPMDKSCNQGKPARKLRK